MKDDCRQAVPTSAHFILELEGLAILRRWWLDPEAAQARVREMADILATMDGDEFLLASPDVPETGLLEGYAAWSETYGEVFNPIVAAEERAIGPLLDELGGVDSESEEAAGTGSLRERHGKGSRPGVSGGPCGRSARS